MSLDGYIAKPGDDLSFLSLVSQDGQDYGNAGFIRTVDTVIIGRRTYDWVMKQVKVFPHENRETYIITRTSRPDSNNTHFFSGSLGDLIAGLKNKSGRNIFVDGGAEIVNELAKDRLIDEYIISIIPVILGLGI